MDDSAGYCVNNAVTGSVPATREGAISLQSHVSRLSTLRLRVNATELTYETKSSSAWRFLGEGNGVGGWSASCTVQNCTAGKRKGGAAAV